MHKVAIAFSALCAVAIAQQPPVGIVTMATGDARIFEPSAKIGRSVEMADVVLPGSRIVTGVHGKVSFVSCSDGTVAEAQDNSEIVFATAGFQVKRGRVGQQHKVPPCKVPVANVGGRDSHIGGVNMRGEATMQLVSPVGTAVDPGQVTFRWQPVEGVTTYRLALRDGRGNDLWESETKAPTTSFQWNGEKKLRSGESYRWRVTALQGEDVLSSASAEMDVFSAYDLGRIIAAKNRRESAESHLLLGMLYEELNAPDLALAEYEKISGAKSKWLEEKVAALRRQL